jgi:hypothetical protein
VGDASISESDVTALNRFSRQAGLSVGGASYEDVVALDLRRNWSVPERPSLRSAPNNEES